MIIAIASGKGGTGKTSLSVAIIEAVKEKVTYLDCDVEEPNGRFFIGSDFDSEKKVKVMVPLVDKSKCNACGECATICQFNAIVCLGGQAMVFPELCHHCGGCTKVCPSGALSEIEKPIGILSFGEQKNLRFIQGKLDIGQAMSPPVIRAVKENIISNQLTIIDCPPGTSCPMITAVSGADFVILVTEPTPFGLHDLKLALKTMRLLKLNFGVIINRCDLGDSRVHDYCMTENVRLLLEVPEKREIAEAYSEGQSLLTVLPEMKKTFVDLVKSIKQSELA